MLLQRRQKQQQRTKRENQIVANALALPMRLPQSDCGSGGIAASACNHLPGGGGRGPRRVLWQMFASEQTFARVAGLALLASCSPPLPQLSDHHLLEHSLACLLVRPHRRWLVLTDQESTSCALCKCKCNLAHDWAAAVQPQHTDCNLWLQFWSSPLRRLENLTSIGHSCGCTWRTKRRRRRRRGGQR